DTLLERIGRPERVFRLEPGRDRNGELATFIVADGSRFLELVARLRLPVLRIPRGVTLPTQAPAAGTAQGAAPASAPAQAQASAPAARSGAAAGETVATATRPA